MEKVLIVEDEPNTRSGLAELVSGWGYRTEVAEDGVAGWERAEAWMPGVVLTDLRMPRAGGLELLTKLREGDLSPTVIVVTAQGSIESAVEAMRLGAYDYIQKPIDPVRLKTILANATRQRSSDRELIAVRRRLKESGALGPLVGSSSVMQQTFSMIEQIAPSTVGVLITGESGTGKELVARTLHELSPRKARPFVAVNCAAIPETLIESEIFGHEKGAFTGAVERRAGCFELAEEGTLLLDEIGEMPIATQAKLLRVLEDHKLRRLGSRTESEVNVRVLAATNKDPQTAVADGHLRGDLYYRLNVFNIHMPPLREHKQDIPAIVDAMLRDMNARHNCAATGVSPVMLERLMQYDWPGNVRELRNTMERAVILCPEGDIDVRHLPPGFGAGARKTVLQTTNGDAVTIPIGTTVDEGERQLIMKTLEATHNNKTKAAEILQISLKTLHNKLKEYAPSDADTSGATR